MLTPEQLAARRSGLGATDLRAIVCPNAYEDAYTVWLSKCRPDAMKAPTGLGYWIAYPNLIGDPEEIADKLLEFGAGWVAPQLSVGRRRSQWTARHTRACANMGIPVYPWPFSYPATVADEVTLCEIAVAEGASGIILDCEQPWNNPNPKSLVQTYHDTAVAYGELFRRRLPGVWCGDAPWPHIANHPSFPAKGFDWVDARMPQVYWPEINRQGALAHIVASGKQWSVLEAAGMRVRPWMPIGVTYGRSELAARDARQLCPGEISAAEVTAFLWAMHQAPEGSRAWSLYTLEMALTDTPNAKSVREVLLAYARGQDLIEPSPIPQALGLEPFTSFFSLPEEICGQVVCRHDEEILT